MSLFPAYGGGGGGDAGGGGGELHLVEEDSRESGSCSSATERRLLASDEEEPVATGVTGATPAPPADCYRDARRDPGNLRVSTLYYPGRPDYRARAAGAALGAARPRRRPRAARYFEAAPAEARREPGADDKRGPELRAALAAAAGPRAELLALEYVRWSREARGVSAELVAAREAAALCPTRRVRDALQRARERALPPSAVLGELRAELAAARDEGTRLHAWERLVAAAGPAHAIALGGAALDAGPPAWYPRVLLAVGRSLRAAGLWERLVLLVELAAAMNFPPAPGAGFPPAEAAGRAEERERALAEREERAARSGLPRGTVWARVERLRAEARWRAGAGGEPDPQRRPGAAELAPVLRAAPPAAAPALLAALLLLARVPPLPASDAVWRALPEEPESGEALAALLRAARRLPPAHAARPPPGADPALRAALAALLDPPHYFSDSTGFLSWVSALWEAACAWAAPGEPRAALLAWRLRWLHALALRAPPPEARRLRAGGRAAVARWAPRDARAHALLARLDAAAGADGARAALRAARAALAARDPAHHALYAARVAAELGGRGAAPALHALVAACLGGELPPDAALEAPPSAAALRAAEDEAVRRCAEYEGEWEAGGDREGEGQDEGVVGALLPHAAGEWGAARVALAAPAERARLERRVAGAARRAPFPARRYLEHVGCALTAHAAAEGRLAAVAGAMLPAFPENAWLALAAAGAPLWARPRPPSLAWPDSHAAALARLVPALLRPEPLGAGADATARAVVRAGAGGCGGAALAGVALAAAVGGARGAEATALAAAAARPHHKWVVVRAAAAAPRLAASLADALLERELRAHALIDEFDRPSPSMDTSTVT